MPSPKPCTPRLDPESNFVIHLSEVEVSCHRPDGTVESVRWDDLQKVEVLTNSDGRLLPDHFWLLHGRLLHPLGERLETSSFFTDFKNSLVSTTKPF